MRTFIEVRLHENNLTAAINRAIAEANQEHPDWIGLEFEGLTIERSFRPSVISPPPAEGKSQKLVAGLEHYVYQFAVESDE